MFKTSYLWSFVRRYRRHSAIIGKLLLNSNDDEAKKQAFERVLYENFRVTKQCFGEPHTRRLFHYLLDRAQDLCAAHNKSFSLIIIPQRIDMDHGLPQDESYQAFIRSSSDKCELIDFSSHFSEHPNYKKFYVDGPLGPHLSPLGNRHIANVLNTLI